MTYDRRMRIVDAEAADAAADLLVAVSAPGSRVAATISRGLKLPPAGDALDAPEPTWQDMHPGYEVVIARQSRQIAELQAERDRLRDDVERCKSLRLKDAMNDAAEIERLRVVLRGENEAANEACAEYESDESADSRVILRAAGRAVGVVPKMPCPACQGTGEDRTHAEYDAVGPVDCSRCRGSGSGEKCPHAYGANEADPYALVCWKCGEIREAGAVEER